MTHTPNSTLQSAQKWAAIRHCMVSPTCIQSGHPDPGTLLRRHMQHRAWLDWCHCHTFQSHTVCSSLNCQQVCIVRQCT